MEVNGKQEDDSEVQQVTIRGTKHGLGIRIVGGKTVSSAEESGFGIFIKEVIKGSLAARDGRLRRGDQLLEANGTSLKGVSNERAVEVLKNCAMSNSIKLTITRDPKTQSDFRRLSTELLLKDTPKGLQHLTNPVATSTPRDSVTPSVKQNGYHDPQLESEKEKEPVTTNTRRSSTSSELTQISTTDISSHDDLDDEDDINENLDKQLTALNSNANNKGEVATPFGVVSSPRSPGVTQLSDVVVSVDNVRNDLGRPGSDSDGTPPPPPSSAPPALDNDDHSIPYAQPIRSAVSTELKGAPPRSRSPPEGKATVTPPSSATLPPSPTRVAPTIHTFAIPKLNGLGIIVAGGVNRDEGPHIFVDKIMDGMDAARDGRLRKGDHILTVNGESFSGITREKALTLLTQLKIRPQVKQYTLVIERVPTADKNTGPPISLPNPQRSTHSHIFDSDTLQLSDKTRGSSGSDTQHSSRDEGEMSPSRHDTSRLREGDLRGKRSTPYRYSSKKEDKYKHDSLNKRMSIDPIAKVKLSKLEWALSYMGYIMSPQQKEKMRSTLDIDANGKVVFVEFVKLAQEMFAFHLDDSHLEENLVYALTQKESLDLPALPRKATSFDQLWREYSPLSSQMKLATSQPSLPQSPSSDLHGSHQDSELEKMRQQLHDLGYRRDQERLSSSGPIFSESEKIALEKEKSGLLAKIAVLQEQLKLKEEMIKQAEVLSEATVKPEELQVLKKKESLANAAAKASRDKANRLEDSMRDLEAELAVLRGRKPELNLDDLRKRLAVVECQLKKEQKVSRQYEVATERLLQFVENCHEALTKTPEADRILYHPYGQGQSVQRGNAVTGNPRPPQYLSRHAKVTATTLAEEAKETIKAVRKMMQLECLPFGWEEAYTEDGQKYFINHETQMTSWVHPVSKVTMAAQRGGSRSSTPLSSHSSLRTPAQPRANQQA